ncbi:translation initiation factor IF-2-like [Molothrus ater]|uniref:translation initiation factor IF-2-like n=1 Tax=Molothrus ater TaxID=84834 RepID=UPI0023E8B4B4|nr:translation initiation factor IF-2-like [Molothrus ater]
MAVKWIHDSANSAKFHGSQQEEYIKKISLSDSHPADTRLPRGPEFRGWAVVFPPFLPGTGAARAAPAPALPRHGRPRTRAEPGAGPPRPRALTSTQTARTPISPFTLRCEEHRRSSQGAATALHPGTPRQPAFPQVQSGLSREPAGEGGSTAQSRFRPPPAARPPSDAEKRFFPCKRRSPPFTAGPAAERPGSLPPHPASSTSRRGAGRGAVPPARPGPAAAPGTAHLLTQSPVRARRDPACAAAGLYSRVTAKAPTSLGFGLSRAPLVFLFCQISTHTHGPRRRLPAPAARPAEEQPPPPPRFPAGAGEQWTCPSREVFTDGDGTSRDLDTPAGVSDTRPAAPRAAARPAQSSALHSLTSPRTWWRGGGRRRGPRLLAANHPGARTATQGRGKKKKKKKKYAEEAPGARPGGGRELRRQAAGCPRLGSARRTAPTMDA